MLTPWNTALLLFVSLASCDTYTADDGGKRVVLYETDAHKVGRGKSAAFDLLNTSKAEEALKLLEELVKVDSTDKELHYYLGIGYSQVGKYEAGIRHCTKAIDLDTGYFGAYVNRGLTRMRTNDLDGAISDLNHAISLNPNDPDALMNRGIILSELKDNARACQDIQSAKSLGGDVPIELERIICNPAVNTE